MTQNMNRSYEAMPKRAVRKQKPLSLEEQMRIRAGEAAVSLANKTLGGSAEATTDQLTFKQAIFGDQRINPDMARFISQISSPASFGKDIVFYGDKHITPEPLQAKVWTFSEDSFEPLQFKIRKGEVTRINPNYYGNLVLSLLPLEGQTDQEGVQRVGTEALAVDFMAMYTYVDPMNGALVTNPSYTKYHTAELDGTLHRFVR